MKTLTDKLFKMITLLAITAWFLSISLVPCTAMAQSQAKSRTLTGTVSDNTCGAKHTMGGGAKKCTLMCVKQMNSKYALVVGDTVYTLEGKEADLEKLAGAQAKVTGAVAGMNIKVSAVSPAS